MVQMSSGQAKTANGITKDPRISISPDSLSRNDSGNESTSSTQQLPTSTTSGPSTITFGEFNEDNFQFIQPTSQLVFIDQSESKSRRRISFPTIEVATSEDNNDEVSSVETNDESMPSLVSDTRSDRRSDISRARNSSKVARSGLEVSSSRSMYDSKSHASNELDDSFNDAEVASSSDDSTVKPKKRKKTTSKKNDEMSGPQITDKNPIMLLNEMKNNCVYELVREDGEPHARTFSYKLSVDDKLFEGTGACIAVDVSFRTFC